MDSLKEIPLFENISPTLDSKYARMCGWREFEENELVIDIEDESTEVRFIMSGTVRIIARIADGKDVILGEMGEGSFFGEIAAIDASPRSANVTTLTRARICSMPATIFMQILAEEPDIALSIMRLLTERVRNLNSKLAEHSFLQAKHRIYSELLRLSKQRASNKEQRIVSPPPTQRELAERIGTRREVVSRELNALEREGHISKAKSGIIILNVGELQKRISEGWKG